MSIGYSAAYWWGFTPWKKAGRESRASFDVLLDREEAERGPHLGRALDLGCGTGERTGHLVESGWDAVGIDNVRQAVDIAIRRTGVADTRFVAASRDDVERAYAGWTVVSAEPADVRGMSRGHRLSSPTWYRLRRS